MYILPKPTNMKMNQGLFLISYDSYLCIDPSCSSYVQRQIQLFQEKMSSYLGFSLELTIGKGQPGDIVFIQEDNRKEESYSLDTSNDMILLRGDACGLWHGMQTLLQMMMQKGAALPKVIIDDAPDIANRGFYFDATRGRIPTLPWLKQLVDKMAYYKMNQLQLYIEHTYLFRNLTELWRDDTPLTATEILELDTYCNLRGIELVPCLSSFGHMYKLLSTKEYAHLCELSNSDHQPFSVYGRMQHHTMNVADEDSLPLIKHMISEFMELFTSRKFNLCADETFDLGQDRSKEFVELVGKDIVYINYVKELAQFLVDHGRTPMFWGDIIVGFPELIGELPKETICLNWGYAWNQREDETKKLAEANAIQYCCPGCCGWNQFVNQNWSAYQNIMRMCNYAIKYHAVGILNTDWGDFLHINHPDFSITGMIYGAAFSWNKEIPVYEEINQQISRIEFGDHSETLLSIIDQLRDNSAFKWESICFFKELHSGITEYETHHRDFITDHISLMETVDEKNETLKSLQEKLYQVTESIALEKRALIYPYIIAIQGMHLFNQIGKFVAVSDYNVTFDIMPDKKELAKELEQWFYHYKKLYRAVSKESELYRIQEMICFYGNYLREWKINKGNGDVHGENN